MLGNIIRQAVQMAMEGQALQIANTVQGMRAAIVTPTERDGGDHGRVTEKNYRRMDKFDGGEDEWKAWSFDFRIATMASSNTVAKYMVRAETEIASVSGNFFEMESAEGREMEKRGRELFEVMCSLTTGDAKAIIKESAGNDGFAAWQLLAKTFSRKTLARTLRKFRECLNPAQEVDSGAFLGKMARWENGMKELERTEGEKIPAMIKLAALTEMCPEDVRDMIFQNVDLGAGGKVTEELFTTIKEKVISWVSNRVAATRSDAVPMDIGGIGGKKEKEEEYYDENGINGMSCYRCGGEGHMSRVCPTQPKDKGKGKGPGGKGFGKGKTGGKDAGKGGKGGDKGKGKGYQGTCFRCGKVGHKQTECYARIQNVEEEWAEEGGEEEEPTEVGGVWLVGNVEARSDGFTKVERKKPRKRKTREIMNVEAAPGGCVMEFHMTDAKRMLAAVSRITKAGNEVHFAGEKDSYIMNVKTRRKMYMRKDRGVYVLDVLFNVAGGQRKGTMVIDSGAAECVMPREFLKELETKPAAPGVRFVAANGEEIGNYGRKEVNFLPFAWQAP
jgi:hypothetical protein